MNPWQKTFYGWTRVVNGHRYSISKYRACDPVPGWCWTYVVRMDGSAFTSPPVAHTTLLAAKAEVSRHIQNSVDKLS